MHVCWVASLCLHIPRIPTKSTSLSLGLSSLKSTTFGTDRVRARGRALNSDRNRVLNTDHWQGQGADWLLTETSSPVTASKVSWLSVRYATSHSWHCWCLGPMINEAALKHQVHEEFHLGLGQEVVKGVRSLPSKLSNGRSHPAQQVLHKTPQSLFQFERLALMGSVNPWVISAVIPWLLCTPQQTWFPHGQGKYNTLLKQSAVGFAVSPSPCSCRAVSRWALAKAPGHFYRNPCAATVLSSLRLHRQNSEEFLAYYMGAVRSCPHFSSAPKTEQYSSGGMLLLGSFSRPHTSEPTPEFHCHTHVFKNGGLVCAQLLPFCVHQYSFFIQCKVLTMSEVQTYWLHTTGV